MGYNRVKGDGSAYLQVKGNHPPSERLGNLNRFGYDEIGASRLWETEWHKIDE
ncbi:hypothetical protein [Cohnella panacarvi]|uniref:hypothetical protein n=1 Tax=Cohnella panacarvi TaxID=400776 RepID=UPI0004B8D430|nr:hypothetical protein [Cohnella panacarvi]